jgi:hypothetical protein
MTSFIPIPSWAIVTVCSPAVNASARREGVGGLSGVRDHDDAVVRTHDRGVLHELHRRHGVRRSPGVLEHRGPEVGRVLARAGADHPDPPNAMQSLGGGVHLGLRGARDEQALQFGRLHPDLMRQLDGIGLCHGGSSRAGLGSGA